MLAEYKTKTNIGVGVGFLLQLAAGGVAAMFMRSGATTPNTTAIVVALAIRLVGLALFVWGCWNYMVGKGYHGAFGLLGLLSCIGLIVLVCFPDKYKDGRGPQEPRGFDPLMRPPPPPPPR